MSERKTPVRIWIVRTPTGARRLRARYFTVTEAGFGFDMAPSAPAGRLGLSDDGVWSGYVAAFEPGEWLSIRPASTGVRASFIAGFKRGSANV